ncbi:hypothetical protein CRV02_12855 [Arcobacter sp. CECT 8989]|uniref:AAA family ATPase n=1 Tax=Arcobacter sp. CECT 8989 TaxID=2044509 RepID=UPI00100B8292|nr:DUF3696 domain-containing protein [Arcobacter sp. CECT 8989]RXJ98935.1 hypothetical protein CRV02_12855 [Arcobacter sp. CECT 8989]
MKKIKSVNIKNLKILKDVFIELGSLTLITGVNSSGKSTFIQALLLLKQNQDSLQKKTTNMMLEKTLGNNESKELEEHIKDILKKEQDKPINLNGEYLLLGERKDVFNQTTYDEDIEIELFIEDLGKYKISCKNKDLIVNLETDAKIPIESIINLFAEDFQYVNTDRIQPNTTYSLSEQIVRKNLIGLKGEYTAHYLDENRHKKLSIVDLKHKNAKTDFLLENVSLWLSEISNGIEVLAKKYPDIQKAGLSYKYTFGADVTNEYTPMNVGFGITYVLPIIVSILKSSRNDLLIIENPESHLHPAGQSKIAELCSLASTNGVQIIIESHSEHFLNGLRVATKKDILKSDDVKIYYFEKKDEKMCSEIYPLSIDNNGNINETWPDGFFDEYRKKLDELIW